MTNVTSAEVVVVAANVPIPSGSTIAAVKAEVQTAAVTVIAPKTQWNQQRQHQQQ